MALPSPSSTARAAFHSLSDCRQCFLSLGSTSKTAYDCSVCFCSLTLRNLICPFPSSEDSVARSQQPPSLSAKTQTKQSSRPPQLSHGCSATMGTKLRIVAEASSAHDARAKLPRAELCAPRDGGTDGIPSTGHYLSVLSAARQVGHEAAHVLHRPFADVLQCWALIAIQKETSHSAWVRGGREGWGKAHKSLKSHTGNSQPAI